MVVAAGRHLCDPRCVAQEESAPPAQWQHSSWRQSFFAFERHMEVVPGDDIEVTGLHNGKLLSFLEGRWR